MSRHSAAPFASALLLAASAFAPPAHAHHSFAMYDPDKLLTVTGTVQVFEWTNPHAVIWLMATAPGGQVADRWSVELPTSPGNLTRMGWTKRSLKPGDRVTIALNPNGRLLLNVVTGGNPGDLEADGLFLSHAERYQQTAEFLTIWRAIVTGEPIDFRGRHLSARNKTPLPFPPVQTPYPPLYFGGSSPEGIEVAAEHVDYYLTWGEPPGQVAEKFDQVRAAAARRGRTVRFGLRIHLIVRETEAEAWAAADRLISRITDETLAAARAPNALVSESEGQRRMTALHGHRRDSLIVGPNLWAGVGLVRDGAGTALVGDPATVAERLREYQAVGVDTVIASGYPHLEEAYRVAELLFPALGVEGQASTIRRGREFDPRSNVRAAG